MSEERESIRRLVLIFNADSGTVSAIFDSARKLLKLKSCTLCAITHGLAGEKPAWRRYRGRLAMPVDHLHRDELDEEMRSLAGELPVVLALTDAGNQVLLGPAALERCRGSVSRLIRRLESRAAERGLGLEFAARSRP